MVLRSASFVVSGSREACKGIIFQPLANNRATATGESIPPETSATASPDASAIPVGGKTDPITPRMSKSTVGFKAECCLDDLCH
jgi:hypothetical protein